MNLGAEPKKIAILAALAVGCGYVFYTNVLSTPDAPRPAKPASKPVTSSTASRPGSVQKGPNVARAKGPVRGAASREFKPRVNPPPEERPNYASIDPTLRLDLLAKVQSMEPEGGTRSLFQFSAAPKPKTDTEVAEIKPKPRTVGPEPPPKPADPNAKPAEPPPPPIPLKFYGFSKPKPDGEKRAFFMEGEEIFVAAEGELVKKRYRVVKIEATSVIMEDTEFKNNRQTLAIQPEQTAS